MFESSVVEDEFAAGTADGIPVRILGRGRRFRVDDRPTPLRPEDLFLHPAFTHLPDWVGWRFQARDDDGRALVFDVRERADHRWALPATYA